jgi:hypothetical protein
MKTISMVVCCGLVTALVGCGPSAQEKLAQEQLKAIEQQKLMVQGFEEAAKKARAEADANPVGQEKMKVTKWSEVLHPDKK